MWNKLLILALVGLVSSEPAWLGEECAGEECVKYRHHRAAQNLEPSRAQVGFLIGQDQHGNQHSSSSDRPINSPMTSNTLFNPYFIDNLGDSVHSDQQIDGVAFAQKLAHQIGDEVKQPNGIIGENTLTKFTILARFIRTMSAEQIKRTSEKVYWPYSKTSPKSSSDARNFAAWVAFRDAVAQAGTGPALVTLHDWIRSRIVEGEEAAELVAILSQTARYPTPEYMDAFFKLVSSEEVIKQRFLNTSAIMSFTNLCSALVDKHSAHSRFPIHAFGRLGQMGEKAVVEQYIPYLESQLRKAVAQGDSVKTQVYIRALGNTAHLKILSIYEPYLEGKHDMTDFQRLTIVASMDQITKVHPQLARSVLFKIYQNIGDVAEVRVAAVMQLMKTNPPAQMLQRMAQFTHSDPSTQVISAVKSAIETASQLTSPRSRELAQNAYAAVHMLATKQYGAQYSQNRLYSYVVEQQALAYKHDLTYIQEEHSIIPSSVFYNLRRSFGGFKVRQRQLAYMTSNVDELMTLLSDQFAEKSESRIPNSETQVWTVDKIANMLNLEVEDVGQVEGNILFSVLGAQRFFSFDNHTIKQLPNLANHLSESLRNGQKFNFTKMFSQADFKIGFPTAMGLPFIYSLSVPTIASLGGEMRAESQPNMVFSEDKKRVKIPASVRVSGDFDMMYAAKSQAKMGFITPFDHQHYIAGLQKNMQINLPIRAAIDLDLGNNKFKALIKPIDQVRKQKMFEYSTVAYTTKHNVLDLTPEVNGEHASKIHIRPVQRWESCVGKDSTGFAFNIKAESEQENMDLATVYNALKRHDTLSAMLFWDLESTINNNNFTVVYDPQHSSANEVKISWAYEKDNVDSHSNYQPRRSEDPENGAATTHLEHNSSQRQQELLKKVHTGIPSSTSYMADLSVEFNGQSKVNYVATAAYASSLVSEKSRFLLFLGKQREKSGESFQAALDLSSTMPKVALVDYQKALQADPTSHIKGQLNFGKSISSGAQVSIQGQLKRSDERLKFVSRHPMSALCEKEMKEGNHIQPACRNATASANYLDQYRFTIKYKNVPQEIRNATSKVYGMARYLAYPYISENIVSPGNKNEQVDINFNFGVSLTSVNVSINSPTLSTQVNNFPLNHWVRPVVVTHPEYNAWERIAQKLFKTQQFPTCVIDKNLVTTFDNVTYPIKLGSCWTVMAFDKPIYCEMDSNFSCIDFSLNIRKYKGAIENEVMVVLPRHEILVQPSSDPEKKGTVRINGKVVSFSNKSIAEFRDYRGHVFLRIYATPTGAVKLMMPLFRLEVVYDGIRVKLQVTNRFREKFGGLCGNFNGDSYDDFMTTQSLILKDPFVFAGSYALVDGTCDGPSREMHERAQKAQGYRKTVLLGDVVSDYEAGRQSSKLRGPVTTDISKAIHSKTRVSHHQGKTCFSIKKVMECAAGYQPSKQIHKQFDFHCLSDQNQADRYLHAIKNGANIDFTHEEKHHTETISLPEKCVKILINNN